MSGESPHGISRPGALSCAIVDHFVPARVRSPLPAVAPVRRSNLLLGTLCIHKDDAGARAPASKAGRTHADEAVVEDTCP